MSNDVKGTPIVKGLGFDSFGMGTNACYGRHRRGERQDHCASARCHFDEHYTPEELNAWKIEARGQVFEPGFKTHMSPLSLCYKKRVYSKNRIPYPMKRVDWDPDGERNPQNRGPVGLRAHHLGRGVPTSSPAEIKRMHEAYGPTSILLRSSTATARRSSSTRPHGCHEPACWTSCGWLTRCRPASRTRWEGWYWGAKHIWGMDPSGSNTSQNNVIKDISRKRRRRAVLGMRRGDDAAGTGAAAGKPPVLLVHGDRREADPHRARRELRQRRPCGQVDSRASQHRRRPAARNRLHVDQGRYVRQGLPRDACRGLRELQVLRPGRRGRRAEDAQVGRGDLRGSQPTPSRRSRVTGQSTRYPSRTATAVPIIRSCYAHEPARLEVALLGMQGVGKPGREPVQVHRVDALSAWTLDAAAAVDRHPRLGARLLEGSAPAASRNRFIPKTRSPKPS